MKKNKRYVYKKGRQPIYRFFQWIMKISYKKPKVFINHNDKIPTDGILVGPHNGKRGPFYISTYYPEKCAVIGASQMLGSYKERFHYLRDVLYMQKNHKKKFPSTLKALFEAIFSIYFYKGMHVIPSYEDMRLMYTIRDAAETMDNGLPIFLFPENSNKGYQKVLCNLHEGFIIISRFVSKKRGKEVPLYPYFLDNRKRTFIIGKPFYLSELNDMDNKAICKYTCDRINELNPYLEEDKKNDPIYTENE